MEDAKDLVCSFFGHLFYVTEKERSGAYKAYKYAVKKKKKFINLYGI